WGPRRRTTCRSSAARGCASCFSIPVTARSAGPWRAVRRRRWRTSFRAANPRLHSTSLRKSESLFLDIRGLRYHVRRWPGTGAPKMLLLHGWMDVSASFQFVVDALRAGQGPERYARWLDELQEPPRLRPYRNFQELADRLRQGNKRLTPERADFLARHWGRETEQGEVVLRGDPAHKVVNPVLYRYE